MSWRALTESDLTTGISGDELSAFRSVALAEGQTDPVTSVISQTINDVRGYIGACKANRLGPAGTIPETLIQTAVDYMVLKIMSRAAGVIIDPNGTRKDNADRAERRLRDVATCSFAVEQPETETTESFGGQTPLSTSPTREFDRASQDGI